MKQPPNLDEKTVVEAQPTWTSDDPQVLGDLEQVFEVFGLAGCMRRTQ